jgi:hypothetical protein
MNPGRRYAALLASLLVGACAGQPATGTAARPLAAANASQVATMPPEMCLRSGTHLRLPEGQCAPTFGRAVTREELERTGEIGIADALHRILPW